MKQKTTNKRYIPALTFPWLTPLYDALLGWTMPEVTLKQGLIERANIQPNQIVLDLGCGTGTLAIMIKKAIPEAQITGLDADPEVLSIAVSKAERAGLNITWDQGLTNELPYGDNSFDIVVSSLVIHHLKSKDKVQAFREVRRVLRPSGWFHIVDFGKPFNWVTRVQGVLMKNFEEVGDNVAGKIVPMLLKAGFESAKETEKVSTIFGAVCYYQAHKWKGSV